MAYVGSLINQGYTRIDLFELDSATTPTTATPEATGNFAPGIMSFRQNITEGFSRAADGTWSITIDNTYDNEDFDAFLESFRSETATDDFEQYTYTDGSKSSASSTDLTRTLVCVAYVGKATKVKVWMGLVQISAESGSVNVEYGKSTKPTITITSIKSPATIAVPTTCQEATIVTAASQNIVADSYGKFYWMTAAA